MKKLLSIALLSFCINGYAAEQAQNQALPLVMIRNSCPHPMHPIFNKYAWAKNGNTWKGSLLPVYRQNPEIMPMPQVMPAHQG